MRHVPSPAIIAVLLATLVLAATPASAGPYAGSGLPNRDLQHPIGVQTVQFYGPGPQDGGDEWDRRRQWREWRQGRDEARIAEAVRRETQMIEQEREQRRAWRHAWREQQGDGYGGGYPSQRGW